MTPILSCLHVYPLKSAAALSPDSVEVLARGIAGDRRWMIVDPAGKFLTGRQLARITLIRASLAGAGLQLQAPDMPDLHLDCPSATTPRRSVTVWKDTVQALPAGSEADTWLSRFLGQPAQLVYMDDEARRPVNPDYARAGDEVSFADGFPLLLVSQAALDHLNTRLATPVSMLQFRPNLIIAGSAAHAEDQWQRIRIGEVEFDLVKPCTRCIFTTVDPQRGERDAAGEPLRTLTGYRRTPIGVTFGQNLIPRSRGTLRVGDTVSVIA